MKRERRRPNPLELAVEAAVGAVFWALAVGMFLVGTLAVLHVVAQALGD